MAKAVRLADVRRPVEHLPRDHGRLGELLVGRRLGADVVDHGRQASASVGAEAHVVLVGGPVARPEVELGAGQHEFDGASDLAGGEGRDGDVGPAPQSAAEPAADEWRDDAHRLLREVEDGGEFGLRTADPLGLVPHGEPVSAPAGDGGVGLHRVVMVAAGPVRHLQPDLGGSQCLVCA